MRRGFAARDSAPADRLSPFLLRETCNKLHGRRKRGRADSDEHMFRAGLLSEEDSHKVIALACEESAACRVTRRVNALVLLEDGWSFREREGTEEGQLYRANIQSRRPTMLNPQTEGDVTQAVQQTFTDGAEQASWIAQLSTNAGERAARAGTEIFQRNVETVQEALQSSAKIAARLTERSADQFGRVFGISGDETHKAVQKSSDNLDAIIQSSSALAGITQRISREWLNFTRERMEQSFNKFDGLARCRTPQDLAAVQSEFLRDNLESFLQCARRIAEMSVHVAEEANKRTAEVVDGAQAA